MYKGSVAFSAGCRLQVGMTHWPIVSSAKESINQSINQSIYLSHLTYLKSSAIDAYKLATGRKETKRKAMEKETEENINIRRTFFGSVHLWSAGA